MPTASRLAAVLALILGTAGLVCGQESPNTDKLNRSFRSLTLTNPDGKTFKLADLKDPKAVVVVFLSFDCPVSTSYSTYLSELARKNEKAGVTVLGVVPTDDTPAEVKKRAAEFKFSFPVFPDSKLIVADAFKAQATPEAFVLDRNLILRYRGRIDDSQEIADAEEPGGDVAHELDDALVAVLAGKTVQVATTPAGRLCHQPEGAPGKHQPTQP